MDRRWDTRRSNNWWIWRSARLICLSRLGEEAEGLELIHFIFTS